MQRRQSELADDRDRRGERLGHVNDSHPSEEGAPLPPLPVVLPKPAGEPRGHTSRQRRTPPLEGGAEGPGDASPWLRKSTSLVGRCSSPVHTRKSMAPLSTNRRSSVDLESRSSSRSIAYCTKIALKSALRSRAMASRPRCTATESRGGVRSVTPATPDRDASRWRRDRSSRPRRARPRLRPFGATRPSALRSRHRCRRCFGSGSSRRQSSRPS